MRLWTESILQEFPADLSRLWIAADPDDVLLDEQILSGLRERGFELLPFEDPIVFRSDYEERYREAWDRGEDGPSKALVLHLRSPETDNLPWDYLRHARIVRLSLANLFPRLSYGVVRNIGAEHRETLFEAQSKHANQSLGESSTKEFILTHIFRFSPHLIDRPEELWRELLRLHYRDTEMPPILASHVEQILGEKAVFKGLPIAEMFSSKSFMLRIVQGAWYRFLERKSVNGFRISEAPSFEYGAVIEVPFEHPDVRAIIDTMFQDGTLHPLAVQGLPTGLPDWMVAGIVQDPAAMEHLVRDGLNGLVETMPAADSTHRDWSTYARRFGEVLSRFHHLDAKGADVLQGDLDRVNHASDERLLEWISRYYADLPSLPAVKAPVMVHHVPRFLSMRRNAGETKIALVVFDGLAVDQWVSLRERLIQHAPKFSFEENACMAWLPTLTSVSRQAMFSGLKPREFSDSIETTAQEPFLWSRFWQDQGLKLSEVLYRKGIRRADQFDELGESLSNPAIRIAGLVVDTIDEIVHGAVLGKRGVANQIDGWCESGFAGRLFSMLLDKGFHVYLASDHGNIDAVGVGRPNQGVIAETRGERVRVYRNEASMTESSSTYAGTIKVDIAGLPMDFLPLFSGGRTAFVTKGSQTVAHGGISVEEMIVPFVKVSYGSCPE